ncbi:MAG: histidinol-phosphatase [Lentisphaerae bacterium]|nr:histidinol-phosphatase [Lentisphaerota bacterium]
MRILADYHMHTPRCKHAVGPLEGYIEKGIALGLREVGFADHNPLPDGVGANVRMDEAELDDYVADVLRLRERYRGAIEVRLGLEMDYVEGMEPYLAEQRRRYPWDYVLGSVHYLDTAGRQISWPRNFAGDIHTLYARYYELVRQMAATGLYDIVAHVDLPKRTGRPAAEPEREMVTQTLAVIARSGMSVEINTSGYRHPELAYPEAYPSVPILREILALGIPLTVNSDAHAPDHVGTQFPAIEALLKDLGCRSLARYAGGHRESYED